MEGLVRERDCIVSGIKSWGSVYAAVVLRSKVTWCVVIVLWKLVGAARDSEVNYPCDPRELRSRQRMCSYQKQTLARERLCGLGFRYSLVSS